jgi:hypothetical protein
MFVRLVTNDRDVDSQARAGLFVVSYDLFYRLRDNDPADPDLARIRELLVWFEENLKKPDRFWSSGRTQSAICWFKDSAIDHIRHLWELKHLLGEHGVAAEMIRTKKPGRLVYEDDHQVAAIPFSDTGA